MRLPPLDRASRGPDRMRPSRRILPSPLGPSRWDAGKYPIARQLPASRCRHQLPTSLASAGTTVTWNNRDDIPHGIASSNNAFKKSGALDTDESYSFTFTAPGTYQYFCYLHPHMVGSIVVEATTGSNSTQ